MYIAAAESIVAAVGAKFVGDVVGVESVAVAAGVEIVLFVFYYAFCTVHPLGIPEAPVGRLVIAAFFTNVPVEDTPDTQLFKHPLADILVASILI